ncbi:MAG: peptidoglycan DD-metalloendopeptidase family protein [Azoarcus sp.]|jgi:septal ring factor EnvC (AmiA/AmiB activator)|nr:peptidoglycan DD-metalloendopeptidase family protein [Azoarcus sp.]
MAETVRAVTVPPLWRVLSALLLASAAGLSLSSPSQAQTGAEIHEKRSDLVDLKRRINDLQRELGLTETRHKQAAHAVAEAERAVSRVARALRRLLAEQAEAEQRLAVLETELREIEQRIASRQDELAGWLRRHYFYGAASDIAALLSARDPNQLARDAHYFELLGRVRLQLIEKLRGDLRLKNEHLQEIAVRREELARLEEKQRRQQEKLQEIHARRRETVEKIAAEVESRREELGALKAGEERLVRLIDTLVQRNRNAAADRDEKETRDPVVGKILHSAGPTPVGTRFAQLRGKLLFPVRGELIGRFGAPRAGQGTRWRGVFIRAADGAEVRAISDGEVVFSDWLRGYGNLLIIDHGDGYLSIYGNNDALYKEVGDAVRGGDTIASVGASGIEVESGLYFEIRHRGEAIDPMQWVKLE